MNEELKSRLLDTRMGIFHPLGMQAAMKIAELETELATCQRERNHWKNNHETEVRRARVLKDRIDLPLERVQAYKQWGLDLIELNAFRDEWVALEAVILGLRADVKSLRARLAASIEPHESEIC